MAATLHCMTKEDTLILSELRPLKLRYHALQVTFIAGMQEDQRSTEGAAAAACANLYQYQCGKRSCKGHFDV